MSLGNYAAKDLEALTKEALEKLKRDCEIELQKRKEARYNYLVESVCGAINTLAKEFPYAELNIFYDCEECRVENSIDVLNYFCRNGNQLTEKDFS